MGKVTPREQVPKKLVDQARKYCANFRKWDGKCSGTMIAPSLQLWVDKDYCGKKCFAGEEGGCEYFKNIVIPGIPK